MANANKERSPAANSMDSAASSSAATQRESSSSVWYEADVESDMGQRSSSICGDDGYSFSDSEGGFQPLRNRLRGLLGSFGKGKKRVHRAGKKKLHNEGLGGGSEIDIKSIKNQEQTSPILKATLGEFTRQIENLSARSEPEHLCVSKQSSVNSNNNGPTYYTARVTSVKVNLNHQEGLQRPVLLRPKRDLVKNDSNDTYTSSVSYHPQSNRNSVISGQSISSESFEHEERSVSDEERHGGTSNSSPQSGNDDLTPEQRHEKKVYYIAREIMTSERVYVDVLRLLNVEFREFVQRARKESKSGIMPDTDFSRIFSNLPELQTLNEDLLQDFEDRIEHWDLLKKVADVIVKKGPFLKLYTTYIREFSTVNYHFDECCQKYPKFGKLVKEFEKSDRCRSLKLKHFMLKPVQRLPQYKLLLEDYLKHLEADSPDFDDTTNALRIVTEAAEHANDTIKQGVS